MCRGVEVEVPLIVDIKKQTCSDKKKIPTANTKHVNFKRDKKNIYIYIIIGIYIHFKP